MSRIGKKPISIPAGVTLTVQGSEVIVKGPKGELKVSLLPGITLDIQGDVAEVKRADDLRQTRAFHGLIRSLISNNVLGVTQGFKKTLQMVGTGYRVAARGQGITLTVGFSHPVEFMPPTGVALKVEGNDTIHIEGADKTVVGQVAANIRKVRPPEPYKGKGIKYSDEVVRRKAGKTAA